MAVGEGSFGIIVQSIAVDLDDNLLVTGYFSGTVDFGGSPLSSVNNSTDIFIAKYSPAGDHLWSKSFGNSQDDVGYGIAADSSGNVIATGFFTGTVDFGGGALTSYSGGYDLFLAKYSPGGTHLWSKRFLNNGADKGYSVAAGGGDDILLVGTFTGKLDLGSGILTSAGLDDIFVAKFSAYGTNLWSERFGGSDVDFGYDVAVDGSNNVFVTGAFKGSADFGGGVLTSAALYDAFVVKLSANGVHLWSKRFGSTSNDYAYRVAVDGSGDVVLTGEFQGTVDFGGGSLVSAGGSDSFLAKYAGANGGHLWSKRFGASLSDSGWAVATDGNDAVLATGYFQGVASFGGGSFTSAGGTDLYLLKLSP